MCGSYALIQLSPESRSQLVNMAGYQLKVIFPIVVLLTVVARVLINREPDMILRYRWNQLLPAARLRRFRTKLVTTISVKKSVVIKVYGWKSDS